MTLLLGDCLEQLKTLPDGSVDSVVTDPPYGLSFMGKRWDYDVPSTEIWREVLRVLKPGGHLLAFGGTRTYHRLVLNIEDAGFEIRDQIMWIYGSGFPKSHNLKGEWQGWGTALKPANEPICLARKPLSEKTVAKNVLKHGTGAINIDAGRVESGERPLIQSDRRLDHNTYGPGLGGSKNAGSTSIGRWPANVLFDEEAAQVLDEQTQHLHGAGSVRGNGEAKQQGEGGLFGLGNHTGNGMRFGDSGGASRFFYVAKASKRERNAGLEGMPKKSVDRYGECGQGVSPQQTPRVSREETNFHPTVKPIKLMTYLIRLITPPGGTVLDPFMGSGSTGVACEQAGFKFIGCEMNPEYFEIAQRRIEFEQVWPEQESKT